MKLAYAIFGAAALTLAACADLPGTRAPAPSATETLLTATATITSVDTTSRIVQVQSDETGRNFTVFANDGIPNLDQLTAGDIVVMQYYESTAVALASPDAPDASLTIATATAPEGELPGGIAVETETLVVEVLSYDRSTGFATFLTPEGIQRRTVVPPRLRSFAAQTRRGDFVEVTLTQAVAVSIEEVES
ncbi:MAG: hypothetical protein AAGG56_08065 [Pseudomonadota bacterium]